MPDKTSLAAAKAGDSAKLGTPEYIKVEQPCGLPPKISVSEAVVVTRDYTRGELSERRAKVVAELARIDAMIAECDKLGVL